MADKRRGNDFSAGVPDPRTSREPFTVVWQGKAIGVSHLGEVWGLERDGRVLRGPAVLATERWSETVERIKEWLDLHRKDAEGGSS